MKYHVVDITDSGRATNRATFDDREEAERYMMLRAKTLEAKKKEFNHNIISVETREEIRIPSQIVLRKISEDYIVSAEET